jgi:signal transduction histidine kinase
MNIIEPQTTPTSDKIWLNTSKVPLENPNGEVFGVLGVYEDITERKKAEDEVFRQREELRGLTVRLAEVEETERKNLARELHDQICQNLASIAITLEALKIRATQESAELMQSRLSDAADLVEQTGEVAREIMEGLRPTVLEHYGLMGGLRWCAEQMVRRTGIKVAVQGQEAEPRLARPLELALFRIAQEALNNVAKHAGASQVVLTEEVGPDTVRLVIEDNGVGFDSAQTGGPEGGHRWGLTTMRERAIAVGGRCRLESQPGRGTRVIVEVNR